MSDSTSRGDWVSRTSTGAISALVALFTATILFSSASSWWFGLGVALATLLGGWVGWSASRWVSRPLTAACVALAALVMVAVPAFPESGSPSVWVWLVTTSATLAGGWFGWSILSGARRGVAAAASVFFVLAVAVSVPRFGASPDRPYRPPSDDVPEFVDGYAAYDRMEELLDPGRMAYNPPSEMRVGDTLTVELLLSADSTPGTLGSSLQRREGAIEAPVGVSELMTVDLLVRGGPDALSSVPLMPRTQSIGRSRPGQWHWLLTANRPGSATLDLQITATLDVGDRSFLNYRSHTHVVRVSSSWVQVLIALLQNNWEWLVGVAGPITAVLVFGLERKRKRSAISVDDGSLRPPDSGPGEPPSGLVDHRGRPL